MDMRLAVDCAAENNARFVDDLKDLARIPSVSFPGFNHAEVDHAAVATAELMKRRGLENVQILRVPGAMPYVYGDWLHAKGAPTLLLYAHHDVQPAGREELWKSPPFTPTVRSGRLYGRGTADDKAGIVVHTSAVAACLGARRRLPVNVKLLIEGEEEIGSPKLEPFLRKFAKKLRADAIVLTDTGNFDTGIPSITTSLRGIVAFDVTVRTADHPLHSGMWGGPLPDPVQALSKIIASMTDEKGALAVPGVFDGITGPTPAEKKSRDSLRYDETIYREQSGVLKGVRLLGNGQGLLAQVWNEPAFSVNAIQASSRKDCANIVNEAAWCHMGLRIVPGMDPAKVFKKLREHIRRRAPWGAKVEITGESLNPAWRCDSDGPVFAAASRALEKGFGRPAVFIGCGGSIPFVGPFSRVLGGAPALLIGVEDPYTNPHSENESLHLGDFAKSIAGAVYLYGEIADLPPAKRRGA